MSTKLPHLYCTLDRAGEAILKNSKNKLGLSARAYDTIHKVARTIANLEGVEISSPILEAIF